MQEASAAVAAAAVAAAVAAAAVGGGRRRRRRRWPGGRRPVNEDQSLGQVGQQADRQAGRRDQDLRDGTLRRGRRLTQPPHPGHAP